MQQSLAAPTPYRKGMVSPCPIQGNLHNPTIPQRTQFLKEQKILCPAQDTLLRLIARQREQARQHIYQRISEALSQDSQRTLDKLIEVDESRILKFPKGILGFPDNSDYALLQTNEEGNFFWLQSVDQPDVAFVVCDPLLFVPDYQVQVRPEDCEILGLASMNDAQVLIVVNKVERTLTGNLQGPLVINALNRLGRQLVLSEK